MYLRTAAAFKIGVSYEVTVVSKWFSFYTLLFFNIFLRHLGNITHGSDLPLIEPHANSNENAIGSCPRSNMKGPLLMRKIGRSHTLINKPGTRPILNIEMLSCIYRQKEKGELLIGGRKMAFLGRKDGEVICAKRSEKSAPMLD